MSGLFGTGKFTDFGESAYVSGVTQGPPVRYVFLAPRPPARALAAYGPLPGGLRTQEAVRRLNDMLRLRDCSQKQPMIFPEQGSLFPQVRDPGCLRMELGTCSGPCTGT